MGATAAVGGARVERRGYYFQPTVLTGVTRDMPVFREETFGPVAAVVRVRDEDEAVAVANDSQYGLGAAVWTGDDGRGRRLAERIEAGAPLRNGAGAPGAQPALGGGRRRAGLRRGAGPAAGPGRVRPGPGGGRAGVAELARAAPPVPVPRRGRQPADRGGGPPADRGDDHRPAGPPGGGHAGGPPA